MGQPSTPRFLIEGPDSACVINGRQLGWKICTSLSFGMGMFKSSMGRIHMSGCDVRRATGDTVGGTTIEQNAKVAEAHGIHIEVHTGPKVSTPYYTAVQLQAGRGFSLAGNTSAIGKGNVNHNIWVNHASGGTLGHPSKVRVYDPWSSGPTYWTWAKLLAFAAALRPWGEQDSRRLGPGKFYCGIFPDTEPHVHPRFNGVKTAPFPDHVKATAGSGRRVNVRVGPSTAYAIAKGPDGRQLLLASGTAWIAFQKTSTGQLLAGSRVWYGNHDGNQWIHSSGIAGAGGTT